MSMNQLARTVLILGGGHGLSGLLQALTTLESPDMPQFDWQVGVGMTDHGGSSGKLRDQFGVPALGDWRRCLTAVSQRARELNFEHRNQEGHALGNLYLLDLYQRHGADIVAVSQQLETELQPHIPVMPITTKPLELVLTLTSGQILTGEGEIGEKTQADPIVQVALAPEPLITELNPGILSALARSSALVIAPGSFWSSQIAAFLPKAFRALIKEKGPDWPIIYLANVAHERGETPHLDLVAQVELLCQYLGRSPAVVLANQELRRFDADLSPLGAVRHLAPPQSSEWQSRFPETELLLAKLLHQRSDLEHDHRKLAQELVKILTRLVLTG